MNWRRGLFRLWLVLSLAWVVFVLVFARYEQTTYGAEIFGEPVFWAVFVAGPSLGLAFVLAAIRWVVAGFRS
jgi:uncharacterized membrane protein (DUF485 family)